MSEIEPQRPSKDEERPLSVREFLGAFLPPKEEDGDSSELEEDKSPLTWREYIGALPSIYDLADMARDAGRGIGGVIRRIKDAEF